MSTRILTWNINGFRSAIRKGIDHWMTELDPEVMLFQEIRARPDQLPEHWSNPEGWHVAWNPAARPGYAGTAIWSRRPFDRLDVGFDGSDEEGRLLVARIGSLDVASVYLPSGSSSEAAQRRKDGWMDRFAPHLRSLMRRRRKVVVGGDLNIARSERDLYHWRSNQRTSGFLPHERSWMDDVVARGARDLLRDAMGDVDGPYTWWSNRGQARALDRGWRIDYLLGNAATERAVQSVFVHREAGLAISVHAPVVLDLD